MVMQNQIIRISREKADNLAMELFIKTTDLNAAGDKLRGCLVRVYMPQRKHKDRINIRASTSFPGTAMNGNVVLRNKV